jgi:hypothetical protein
MLRRSVFALAVIGFALATPAMPAHAQGADLTRATCADLNRLPSGERRQIGLWLHGYYTGAAQRPFLDMGRASLAIAAMLEDCREDPERPLLGQAVGDVLRGVAPARPRSEAQGQGRGQGHIVIEQEGAPEAPPPDVPPGRPRPID